MKSSVPPARSQDEAGNTEARRGSPNANVRPPLVRTAPEHPSEAKSGTPERRGSQADNTASRAESGREGSARKEDGVRTGVEDTMGLARVDVERLDNPRDAMTTRMPSHPRARRSHAPPQSDFSSPRVLALQDENSTKSINAVLARTGSTDSTDSTNTVRAGPTSAMEEGAQVRTPSYPFPFVPNTPSGWSKNFHQPFTALSPTASGGPKAAHESSGSGSQPTSPAISPGEFLPPSSGHDGQEDPRFPTPSLYEMILQLNTEPGLEQWWTTVTNLMHDHFQAARATLVVPRDSSDIENAPWAQKATFSMDGPEDCRRSSEQSRYTPESQRSSMLDISTSVLQAVAENTTRQELHPERLRPRLEARHSYAGHGTDRQVKAPNTRPAGPQRTATIAAGLPLERVSERLPTQRLDSTDTQHLSSLGNPDFSSAGGRLRDGPYAAIFTQLRTLDVEDTPLIEPRGVSRVLQRGKVVVVTRDYSSNPEEQDAAHPQRPSEQVTSNSAPTTTPRPSIASVFGNHRSMLAEDPARSPLRPYEEYEQYSSSAWSQSPAPSPAIQSDEEDNPFFAANEQQVEDSFNPTASPKDYSQLGQVEAIGVERASTVVHIPLIHPTISQPMQSLDKYRKAKDGSETLRRSNTLDMERKAPIAILSLLASTVPYPQNLVSVLQLLGPHLATSLATSQQFSSGRPSTLTIRHRRTETGQFLNAPMTVVPASLEDMVGANVDRHPRSLSASLTSPSEYAGQSPYSTNSSIVETPGWDPATHGWTSPSGTDTAGAAGTEMVDSYFEAKRRPSRRNNASASARSHQSPVQSKKRASGSERYSSVRKSSIQTAETSATKADAKRETDMLTRTDAPPKDIDVPPEPKLSSVKSAEAEQPTARDVQPNLQRRPSLLHSYGADIQSSFGGLPSSANAEPPTPSIFGHTRNLSQPADGMPPPSERLLRTIIDSVPVQIFTAEPDTGKLTWVNSKFMVYRAQEATEILANPWQAIHPDDRDEFMSTWQRSLRTAQQLQQRVRLMRFDGTYRWFYVRAAPLKDKKQKIVHWIGTMMDFHEQNLAQETAAKQHETAASEAKYRALANSSPQIVFAVNKVKGIVFCNTQWVQFSGQTEKQARGLGFMDHVHPEDLAKCKLPIFDEDSDLPKGVPTSVPPELSRKTSGSAHSSSGSSETERASGTPIPSPIPRKKLSELAETGILKLARDADGRPSYSTEVRLKSKDGEYRWHLVRLLLAEPFLQMDEGEETWYGTCTDISDHKALERDLKQAMDEKSRFLSNMSHEIRTPLNGITGMVNFLMDSSLTTEQMEHVNIIRASTEGLRGLINDILDLSKAEAGMIQLHMDWFHIRALLEEVNDLTSAMAIDKGIELNYLVEEEVPIQFKGDRFRLRQILLNIIGNAIKFTQTGEVFIHCSINTSHPETLAENEMYIQFEVIDTGRGFTSAESEILFKRFSQIDGSSTRQHGGSGLGLVISRQLTQLHGGDMTAKGEPGKGSTFTCFIKATLPSSTDEPPTPLSTPGDVVIPVLPIFPASVLQARSSAAGAARGPTSKPTPELTQSPAAYDVSGEAGKQSPAVSSVGSEFSMLSTTRTGSTRSGHSSGSSSVPDMQPPQVPMNLAMPKDAKDNAGPWSATKSSAAGIAGGSASPVIPTTTLRSPTASLGPSGTNTAPPMYSILVVCPLKHSRQATVQHIDQTLSKNVPHQIVAKEVPECQKMIRGDDPVIFTHIVIVLQDVGEITSLMDHVLASPAYQATSVVIITDLMQKRRIIEQASEHDYPRLGAERRLLFVFKPLKPSRFAAIFDPRKEREMSFDRNQDSAQQVALTQKQVFEEVTTRLGNRDKRVLLVEDNKTNQLVVKKFLSKVSIDVDTAIDGIECTERVFSKPAGHYSIVLCDLHMPNKDGYQTCREIRQWERDRQYAHMPIIALSANVLGDVHEKCVDSGFNSYLTKPVDFKELGTVLVTFMDPHDPSKPHEFMKMKATRRRK